MKKSAKPTAAIKLAQLCCRALDEKKAEDLRVLDVSAQSSITDCLVLATATSEPHMRALRIELEKALDGVGAHILGIESAQESGWTVVDVFDVMVHIFTRETRAHFALENLWKDAAEVSATRLLAAPKPQKKSSQKSEAKEVEPNGSMEDTTVSASFGILGGDLPVETRQARPLI